MVRMKMGSGWMAALSIVTMLGCASGSTPTWTVKQKPDDSQLNDDPPADPDTGSEAPDAGGTGAENPIPKEQAPPKPKPPLPRCDAPLEGRRFEDFGGESGCRPNDALRVDNLSAGLDFAPGTKVRTMDGQQVTGCVRIDFGKTQDLDPIVIYRRTVGAACMSGVPCSGNGCGQGHQMVVFRGVEMGEYTYVATYSVNSPISFQRQFVYLNTPTRYVVVCRPGTPENFDDIEVDAILACKSGPPPTASQ